MILKCLTTLGPTNITLKILPWLGIQLLYQGKVGFKILPSFRLLHFKDLTMAWYSILCQGIVRF